MERKAVNDMFVVLSDIWLDDEEVIGILILLPNFCFHSLITFMKLDVPLF